MDWISGLIIAAANVAVTTIVGLVITAWFNKKAKDREELETLREEKHNETIKKMVDDKVDELETKMDKKIDDMDKKMSKELDDIDNDLDAMKKAQQKDIRRSLRQDGKMMKERGWATDQEKQEFDELYWSYHNLGKNGVADQLHKEVLELPSIPPKDN